MKPARTAVGMVVAASERETPVTGPRERADIPRKTLNLFKTGSEVWVAFKTCGWWSMMRTIRYAKAEAANATVHTAAMDEYWEGVMLTNFQEFV
jgi:hypothetical protein